MFFQSIRNKVYLFRLPIVISILLCVWSFIGERYIFAFENFNHNSWLLYWTVKLLFILIVFFSSIVLYLLIGKAKVGDIYSRTLLVYSGFMLLIFFFFLLLLWPGNWNNDEFLIFNEARSMHIQWHQGYVTSVFFMLGMMLFPSPGAIASVQVLICALCIGNMIATIQSIIGRKLVTNIYVVLFFMPFSLYYIFYPLRVSLTEFLLITLLCKVIAMFYKEDFSIRNIVLISFYSALLAVIRMDSIPYLFILPSLLLICMWKKTNWMQKAASIILPIVVFMLMRIPVTLDPNYHFTSQRSMVISFVTSLSVLVADPDLKSDNLQRDLKNIDQILPVKVLRENASSFDYDKIWGKIDQPLKINAQSYQSFMYSTINLIIRNPLDFFSSKFDVFSRSTGLHPSYFWVSPIPDESRINDVFAGYNIPKEVQAYFNPISPKVRIDFNNFLRGEFHIGSVPGRFFFWSQWLSLLLVPIVLLFSIARRQWLFLLISLIVSANGVIIYLMEPVPNPMYFFPMAFLSCIITVSFVLLPKENSRSLESQ
jgi:hypothetical protein